jgi:PAS domain S-box-containing protein
MSQSMPPQVHGPGILRGQKILLVEDDAAARAASARVVRAAGCDVLEIDRAGAAAAIAAHDPSLLVLDSHLTRWSDPAALMVCVRALLWAREATGVEGAAQARFRSEFELASNGVALLDRELNCRDVNPAFCATAGRERADIIDGGFARLVAPGQAAELQRLRSELERLGYWVGTLSLQRADGGVSHVEWRIVSSASGDARIAVSTDITQRRAWEAERERLVASERDARADAERGKRRRDEFLAMMAHELRNPLNAVLGWARVLSRLPGNTPLVAQGIEAIERNSRAQSQLIADLLELTDMQSGPMQLDLALIEPCAAIAAELQLVAAQASAKGVQIHSHLVDCDARVPADGPRLQRVVRTLLSNALRFTPRGGRIELRAQLSQGCFQIEIADSGQGIQPELLARIFDPFGRADAAGAEQGAGLALGLAIVRQLVEAHGGTIDASSAGEGRGASFRVRLPLKQDNAPPAPLTPSQSLSGVHALRMPGKLERRAHWQS